MSNNFYIGIVKKSSAWELDVLSSEPLDEELAIVVYRRDRIADRQHRDITILFNHSLPYVQKESSCKSLGYNDREVDLIMTAIKNF